MRTKTLLLTAALSAAGLATSMAQVYSINTVGYVNYEFKGGNAYTLTANPLDNAGTNNVIGLVNSLPNGSSVSIFTGAGYNVVTKNQFTGVWGSNPALPVGQGFFVRNSGAGTITNTYVGSVVPGPGGTNTVAFAAGIYQQVGSVLPVAGDLTSAGSQGPGQLNLGSTLPNGSTVTTWDNSGAGAYVVATKNQFSGAWSANPTLAVGQGFFVNSKTASSWTQIYP
jgi:hypothetical protein